jgi:hypothetical protein
LYFQAAVFDAQVDPLCCQGLNRLLRPAGKLVLSMNSNETIERELLHYLDALQMAT